MVDAAPAYTTPPPLIAIGVLSAPLFVERRDSLRATWMRWPEVGRGKPVRVLFVVRSLGASAALTCQLDAEQRHYGDIAHVAVPWNETRLRGPVLSLAAWLEFASQRFGASPFVAKMDDDAYIHVADLTTLLRSVAAASSNTPLTYFGTMSWFHWYPEIFERSGFGWTFSEAWQMGMCRNQSDAERRCKGRGCGGCVGPFPFASGFLIVLSTPLAAELAASAGLRRDLDALRATPRLVSRAGRKQGKVMEDIWLGSLIFRFPPSRPVRFVALSEAYDPYLVSDNWGLRARHTAMLAHVKGKQLERFLALHDFMSGEEHCSPPQLVQCELGCEAFDVKMAELRWAAVPRVRRMGITRRDRRLAASPVCSGPQQNASFCRLWPSPNRTRCRKQRGGLTGVNLLPRVQNAKNTALLPRVERRKREVLQAGTAQLVANACEPVSTPVSAR